MTTLTWCVAHTQPLKEATARQNLLDQGYQVYLPRFKKICRHARKVEEKLAPLFPRYIFVGLNLEADRWRSINGTRGVSHLLMSNDITPAKVPTRIIEELKLQGSDDDIVPISSLVTFTKGDKMVIVDGAFKDQLATFEAMDDKSRVKLFLTFMGREMKISLPLYAVEAAA